MGELCKTAMPQSGGWVAQTSPLLPEPHLYSRKVTKEPQWGTNGAELHLRDLGSVSSPTALELLGLETILKTLAEDLLCHQSPGLTFCSVYL